jgi:hypothetical protein
MHKDNLEKPEIQRQINELFNLADSSFVRSDNQIYAYKLGRPAPKVSNEFTHLDILFTVVLFR